MTKKCNSCGALKSADLFHKRTKSIDGLQSRCKDCNRKQRNEYYKTANGKQKNDLSGKRWRIQQRKFVYEYLLSHPCECGESDPVVLEFDHDDPSAKVFNISAKTGAVSNKVLLQEMEKCTVRCANCHRRKTAADQGWYEQWAR